MDKLDQIYDGLGSQAKLSVYQFLTTYENERALITYLKLLDKEGGKMKRLPTGSLYDRPRFPEILFPRLLSHARNKDISDDIYLKNGIVKRRRSILPVLWAMSGNFG